MKNRQNSHKLSRRNAEDFKLRSQGVATVINSLMPLLLLVALVGAIILCNKLGVELQPYAETITAIWSLAPAETVIPNQK